MTIWDPESIKAQRSVYMGIADALVNAVRSGRLRPGERLPTHRELARRLGVNVVTVTRGYAEAARRGLVEGAVGRGTFVRRGADDRPALLQRAAGPPLIDFNFNIPVTDPTLLDVGGLFAGFAAEPERAPLFTGYQTHGLPEHRAAGATWISRAGLEADVDRVLVCGGVQHAMTLALSVLARPGDVVLTEAQTYPGIKSLASVLGLELVAVPSDDEGLLPDALDAACAAHKASALYTMPTIHNPTGVVLPDERRTAIVEVARRHDLSMIEDDTFGFLCSRPPRTLASLAPERTWYVVGTSKSIAAGLRIGYLAVPDVGAGKIALVDRTAAQVTAVGWMAAPLMAEIATRWIEAGAADDVVRRKRQEVAARRRSFDVACGDVSTPSHRESPHVWLPLPPPWTADEFVAQARSRGVALAQVNSFAVGAHDGPAAVRVCLGTPPTRRECERGVALVAELLAGRPESMAPVV